MSNNSAQDQDPQARKDNKRREKRRIMRVVMIVIVDILLIGIGLLIFAYFHHVRPQESNMEAVVLPTPSLVQTPEPTVAPTQQMTAVPEAVLPTATPYVYQGMWGEKFADKLADGDVIKTENSYISEDISIVVEKVQEDGITYFVADIYLRNIENFRTAFAGGEYGGARSDETLDMAIENDAVLAVSGDFYRVRPDGIVIRNGVLYRDDVFEDILIMNYDGSMQTYSPEAFDIDAVLTGGAYQGWSFGPMLLTDGLPMEKFNSTVNRANPRCAIGYYEPGHYCFILVDGRQPGYSNGMTMQRLSQVVYDLGCTVAYNLDGGQSAVMVFDGELASRPYNGGRKISDIVYIAEVK